MLALILGPSPGGRGREKILLPLGEGALTKSGRMRGLKKTHPVLVRHYLRRSRKKDEKMKAIGVFIFSSC